jgi:glycosyltransferase involved in cell wall biosynthesis
VSDRLNVVYVSNALGIGGTERSLVNFARRLDRSRFAARAVTVHEDGPRRVELEREGIPVACAHGDAGRLAELLRDADVVHVFRHGIHEPIVPAAARQAGVRTLVETNIFGAVDTSPDERDFACHLFISKMCLLRYHAWTGGADPAFDERHRVLYLPVELERLRAGAPERAEAKRMLGLDPERPVVGRVGRAADLKWRTLLIDMAPHLLRLRPDAQLLYVGITPAKRRRLERLGLLDRVSLPDGGTAEDDRLAVIYAACDVSIGAAAIGESLGLATAEAMAFGIPAVTCSTPWADNAQLELVENGRTGWIANHPRPFAEAVAGLLEDPDARARLGAAAAEHVRRLLGPAPLTRQLERLYDSLVAGAGVPSDWSPSPLEVEEFAKDYPRRAREQFRPLTARERAEARAERLRERAQVASAMVDARLTPWRSSRR